ncbi:hypothetical protein [Flavobacterium suzhouense]|uniref:Outer membrane protein beta-barrel domain-containing protein n=1 Tax=Flavobacterium suzhouense TaxID=1529638 RepID=A0ABW5NRX6_9FLAO
MTQKITLLLLFISAFCFSQQDTTLNHKYRIYFDTGLYKTSYRYADKPGMFLQAGTGLKLNKYFWFNFDIIHYESKGDYENNLFSTTTTATSGWMFMPNFSKDFIFSQKHHLTASLGFFYLREYSSRPEFVSYTDGTQTYIDLYMSNQKVDDFGLFLSAAYKYKLNKNVFIGLQLSSYVQLYISPEAFMIGPSLEFRL